MKPSSSSASSRTRGTVRRGKRKASCSVAELEKSTDESEGSAVAQMLDTIQSHLKDIRDITSCRICVRPLYEPYTLGCGHTFCYSCLVQWFKQEHSKKTCPDCRSKVKQQPAPAYLLRELIQVFTTRPELLVDGETTEQHRKQQEEEKKLIDQDKSNNDVLTGGLFQGLFNHAELHSLRAIRDVEMGIDRCPRCGQELLDGICAGCELTFDANGEYISDIDSRSEAETIYSDEDLDNDLELDDEEDELDFDPSGVEDSTLSDSSNMGPWDLNDEGAQSLLSDAEAIETGHVYMDTDVEDDDYFTEDNTSMVDFIDDDDDDDTTTSVETSTRYQQPSVEIRSSINTINLDSDDDSDTGADGDFDEEGPITNGRCNRRNPPVVYSEFTATSTISKVESDDDMEIDSSHVRPRFLPNAGDSPRHAIDIDDDSDVPLPPSRRRRQRNRNRRIL